VISTDTAHINVAVVIHYFINFIFHQPHNLNVIGTFNHADFFIVWNSSLNLHFMRLT